MKRHLQTKLLTVATVAALGATGIAQAGGPPESNAGAGSTPEQVTSAAGVSKDTSSTERSSTAATDREDLPSSPSTSTPAAGSSANPSGTSTAAESSPTATSGTSGTTGAAAPSPSSPAGTDTTSGLERSTTDTTTSTTGSTPAIGTATGGSPGTAMSREGLIRHEGDTYFIKEGRAQKVDNEMKLSEGITAQENGKITLKDGTELTLEEGKMVTLEGKVVDTPAQVSSVVTNNSATATTPQE